MEISIILAKQIITMFFMVFVGVLLSKFRLVNMEQSRSLSTILIYVFTPCLILNSFQTEYTADKAAGLAAVSCATLLTLLSFTLLTRLMKKARRPLSSGESLCAIFSNSGNLIVPIVLGMFGEEYVIYTCPYVLLQNILMWTYGLYIIGGSRGSIKNLVLKPSFIAIVLGICMFLLELRFPAPLANAVSSLGSCTGTVSMLVIGVLLAETDLKAVMRDSRIYRAVLLRLIIFPLIAMLFALIISRFWYATDYETIYFIFLLGSMGPSASNITNMAQVFNHPDDKLISSINAVTVLLCMVTMPLMSLVFNTIIRL